MICFFFEGVYSLPQAITNVASDAILILSLWVCETAPSVCFPLISVIATNIKATVSHDKLLDSMCEHCSALSPLTRYKLTDWEIQLRQLHMSIYCMVSIFQNGSCRIAKNVHNWQICTESSTFNCMLFNMITLKSLHVYICIISLLSLKKEIGKKKEAFCWKWWELQAQLNLSPAVKHYIISITIS